MQIFVVLPMGNSITLTVNPANTVRSVKDQIQGKAAIPRRKQRLIFNDVTLENGQKLRDYNIQKPFDYNIKKMLTLHVALRIKGAGKRAKPDTSSYVQILSKPIPMTDDPVAIAHAVLLNDVLIDPWLRSKSLAELFAMQKWSEEHPVTGNLDFIIKRYIDYVNEVQNLEARPLTNAFEPLFPHAPEKHKNVCVQMLFFSM